MEKSKSYKGFEFSWREPPLMTGGWQVSIAGTTKELMDALVRATGEHGSHIVTGIDLDNTLAQAEAFVGGLLGPRSS